MSLYEDRTPSPPPLILGLCLAVGPRRRAAGSSARASRASSRDARTVTVKGLVEREVKSDQAVWTLSLRRASDTLADAHQRITADRDAVLAFLKKQGFADAEIERQPTRRSTSWRATSTSSQGERFRYVVTTSVEVTTAEGRPRARRHGRDGGTAQGRRHPRQRERHGRAPTRASS